MICPRSGVGPLARVIAFVLVAGAQAGQLFAATEAANAAGHVRAESSESVIAPVLRRGLEQTFLTFPEWYLVHSPAEYAQFVREHDADRFPFLGHIGQFWSSYREVAQAARRYGGAGNPGYHLMIWVIGVSTTVEYALRSAYETLAGRLSALTRTHGHAAEERFAAVVAQDYVDFIRVRPWYEYSFSDQLAKLWTEVPLTGPDLLRKWERRYALTTEYGVKALYAVAITAGTQSVYAPALDTTQVVVDREPDMGAVRTAALRATGPVDVPKTAPVTVVAHLAEGRAHMSLPRYEAFKEAASLLAAQDVNFVDIAGNRTVLLVSVLAPMGWTLPTRLGEVLFVQPVITQPGRERQVRVIPVASLSAALRAVRADAGRVTLEHVYDY